MIEKGILKVQRTEKGFHADVEIQGKSFQVPHYFIIKASLDNHPCDVERQGGQIKNIIVDGKELARKGQHQKSEDFVRENRDKDSRKYGGALSHEKEFTWSIDNTKLPNDTRELLKSRFGEKECENKIDNYFLKLVKCAQWEIDKPLFYKTQKGKEIINVKPDYKSKEIRRFIESRNSAVDYFSKYYASSGGVKLKIDWRLVVGLGSGSVYETSMTLHHIYGIPYIPGSAVKGVMRNYIVAEYLTSQVSDNLNILNKCIELPDIKSCQYLKSKDETKAPKQLREDLKISEQDKNGSRITIEPSPLLVEKILMGWDELILIRKIFGNQKQRGTVIFVDAYPVAAPIIEADIMNPHYSEYYSGDGDIPPADYLDPKPIFFLTVKNTEFYFHLLAKKKDGHIFDQKIGGKTIVRWLKEALSEHGIGAKTAVGYGRLRETEERVLSAE